MFTILEADLDKQSHFSLKILFFNSGGASSFSLHKISDSRYIGKCCKIIGRL